MTREEKQTADLIDAIVNVPVNTERAAFILPLPQNNRRLARPIATCMALKNESAIDILNAIHSAGYVIRRKRERKAR